LQGDEDTMRLALEDSDTGSYSCMITTIWHYTAHGDTNKLEAQLDELIQRYESEQGAASQGRVMKSFIPLIPALANARDPRREAALDHFGKSADALIFRWILIEKYKLPTEEAIRFLGGRDTDRQRRVMILYLLKDKAAMRTAVADYIENTRNTGAGRVLAIWLESKLVNVPSGIEEKDLRDPNAKSIRQAVLEKLAMTGAGP